MLKKRRPRRRQGAPAIPRNPNSIALSVGALRGLRESIESFRRRAERIKATLRTLPTYVAQLPKEVRTFAGALWVVLVAAQWLLKDRAVRHALNKKLKDLAKNGRLPREELPQERLQLEREWLLQAGLTLALDEAHVPQERGIRLGKNWERNPDGTKALNLRPDSLPLPKFLRWVLQNFRKRTTELLALKPAAPSPRRRPQARRKKAGDRKEERDKTLDLPPGRPIPDVQDLSGESLDKSSDLNLAVRSLLDILIDDESQQEQKQAIAILRAFSASPRQRELMTLLDAGAELADLPKLMRLTPQAVDSHLRRLRKKISDLL